MRAGTCEYVCVCVCVCVCVSDLRVCVCVPQGGAGSSSDLSLTLRAGKNALRTSAFQEEIITQVSIVTATWIDMALHGLPRISVLPLSEQSNAGAKYGLL